MPAEALFGFLGVLLGSLSTSILTISKERLTTKREAEVRDRQYKRERQLARDAFRRDSILASVEGRCPTQVGIRRVGSSHRH
ncbi:hypothetical protein Misp01_79270 [Microtetraspora sp. NBRC 13810]|nr:hypothetical protein Misp01_79270 [Microtetraspora sp. NBRC 13810]